MDIRVTQKLGCIIIGLGGEMSEHAPVIGDVLMRLMLSPVQFRDDPRGVIIDLSEVTKATLTPILALIGLCVLAKKRLVFCGVLGHGTETLLNGSGLINLIPTYSSRDDACIAVSGRGLIHDGLTGPEDCNTLFGALTMMG